MKNKRETTTIFSFYCSRTVATEQREQLVTSEQKLEEIRDDSAKQVLAFREQADVLADETCRSEEAAIQLRGLDVNIFDKCMLPKS